MLPVAFIIYVTAASIRDLREHHNRMNQYEAQAEARRVQTQRDAVVFENLRIARQDVENSLHEFNAKFGDTLKNLRTDINKLTIEEARLEQELSKIEK